MRGPEEALEGICAGVSALTSGSDAAVAAAAAQRIAGAVGTGTHDLELSSKGLKEARPLPAPQATHLQPAWADGVPSVQVPVEVWRAAPKLSSLSLAKNALRVLDPALLESCTGLVRLSAQSNQLRAWPLPAAPGCLPSLAELNLSYNAGLPQLLRTAFASCAGSLHTLDLSGAPRSAISHSKQCLRVARTPITGGVRRLRGAGS